MDDNDRNELNDKHTHTQFLGTFSSLSLSLFLPFRHSANHFTPRIQLSKKHEIGQSQHFVIREWVFDCWSMIGSSNHFDSNRWKISNFTIISIWPNWNSVKRKHDTDTTSKLKLNCRQNFGNDKPTNWGQPNIYQCDAPATLSTHVVTCLNSQTWIV